LSDFVLHLPPIPSAPLGGPGGAMVPARGQKSNFLMLQNGAKMCKVGLEFQKHLAKYLFNMLMASESCKTPCSKVAI